jgi:hypothetical protein
MNNKRSESSLKKIIITVLICTSAVLSPAGSYAVNANENQAEVIKLGEWTEESLTDIMVESSKLGSEGERISFISGKFFGTPYQGSTLMGDINTPEVFTIDLEGVDCFTFIDYVEAMSLSKSFKEFKENLRKIRYRNGVVAFQNRNHFFSDWPLYNYKYIEDKTPAIGGGRTQEASKNLNRKSDGTLYLPGIPVINRTIYYLPSSALDKNTMNKLRTGDYAGIYTEKEGLDVSHTGIIIRKGDKVYLRHASSRKKNKKVVDEQLSTYIKNKPGLVIYRPVQ